MREINCIAIDDNEIDRLTISDYLTHFPNVKIIGIFESPAAAMDALKTSETDVIFLDIDMPGMTGLEVREKFSEIPACVFTTDHPEFAIESFDLDTLDYLLKPYSFERFSATMDRINEYLEVRDKAAQFENLNQGNTILIKEGHEKIKININDILYLNTLQNYTTIITDHGKWHVLSALSSMLENPDFESFVRIHRSYAINKRHIRSLNSKEVTLTNGVKIPVGRSYKNHLSEFEF